MINKINIFNGLKPFELKLDLNNCDYNKYEKIVVRKLSDVSSIFADKNQAAELQKSSNPIIYYVGEIEMPKKGNHISFGVSKINPGKIGSEFFMTKGHYHKNEDGCEIYICLEGQGYLLMQSREKQLFNSFMEKGSVVYVPPGWGHRTVNCGQKVFSCLYFMPANMEHDYESIENSDFETGVFEINNEVCLKKK